MKNALEIVFKCTEKHNFKKILEIIVLLVSEIRILMFMFVLILRR